MTDPLDVAASVCTMASLTASFPENYAQAQPQLVPTPCLLPATGCSNSLLFIYAWGLPQPWTDFMFDSCTSAVWQIFLWTVHISRYGCDKEKKENLSSHTKQHAQFVTLNVKNTLLHIPLCLPLAELYTKIFTLQRMGMGYRQ